MPLFGTMPSQVSSLSSWPPSSSYLILLAVAIVLIVARRYNQSFKPSGYKSHLSRTATSEKDGTAVPQKQHDFETLEQIQCDAQLATPSPSPLPPISGASTAVLSHQHTISLSSGSKTGAPPYITQNKIISHPPYQPGRRQGHASSYYQDTASEVDGSATDTMFRNPKSACIADIGNVFNGSPLGGECPPTFAPPAHYTNLLSDASLYAEASNPIEHPSFNPAMHPCGYSLPPVRKQRESLQVFRGIGPEKGRTWRRKVLEYS